MRKSSMALLAAALMVGVNRVFNVDVKIPKLAVEFMTSRNQKRRRLSSKCYGLDAYKQKPTSKRTKRRCHTTGRKRVHHRMRK